MRRSKRDSGRSMGPTISVRPGQGGTMEEEVGTPVPFSVKCLFTDIEELLTCFQFEDLPSAR